jgi:hypothetical protein
MNRLSHRPFCAALVIAFVLQFVPTGVARAQETVALSDQQVKERLSYIENALRAGQPHAGTWYYGWIAAYSVGAVGGGILAGSHWTDKKEATGGETVPDREFAEGMLVGGATFVLGVCALLIDPFTPATAPNKLGRVPGNTADEQRAKLQQAEELLRKCARREVSGRSLRTHLMNLGGNVAAGIVTKTVFHQSWTNALITFASGEAVSLIYIFSQPMRATRDLSEYEAKYLGQKGGSRLAPQERKWTVSVWPGGLTFRLEF